MKPGGPVEADASRSGRRILLIVIGLILYGSLYPWRFHGRPPGPSPLWILLHSWPGGINRYLAWDIAVNVALYVPMGLFGFLAVREHVSKAGRILAPLVLAVALSASVEMIQLYDDSRECSAADLASNTAGAAVGISLGALYRRRVQQALAARQTTRLLQPSGALLLLSCWLGYQVFPLFPAWGRSILSTRIAALGPLAAISPVETLVVFAEWVAVAYLLERLLEKKTTSGLALLLLVPPMRLLIAGRSVAWPDLVGAFAAFGVWVWIPRRHFRRMAPVMLAAAVALSEVAPFHLGPATCFNWVPFRGFFDAPWQSSFVLLFRKSFWYGSVIWLWHAAGFGIGLTTAVVAAALVLLEWVQVYLPGRTAEISDAVLAILMGTLLYLLDSKEHAA